MAFHDPPHRSGVVSRALFALSAGAMVEIDGPYGLAYPRQQAPREIVCVAGGSGLAPTVSVLDAAAHAAATCDRQAWLFYGGRGPTDVPALDTVLGVVTLASCLTAGGLG